MHVGDEGRAEQAELGHAVWLWCERGRKGRRAERVDDWAEAKQASHGREREGERKRGEGLLGHQQAKIGKGKGEEGRARSRAGLKMKKGKFFKIKFFSKSIFQF